jgi:hypothetical protein
VSEHKKQEDEDFDQYFINGRPVDKETWAKYNRDYQRTLSATLRRLGVQKDMPTEGIDRFANYLQAARNEITHNLIASGVSAALTASADATWFRTWAVKELPDILAQSQFEAMTRFDELKQKQENAWPARLRRGLVWLISGIVLALISVLAAWGMGIIGFK